MNEFRFLYIRNADKFPVACIAYNFSYDSRTVLYGVSTFNLRDEDCYNQHTARELAVGRAILDKQTMILPKGLHKLHDIVWMLVAHLGRDKNLPTRTRKAIKAWLERTAQEELCRTRVANMHFDTPTDWHGDESSNGAIELEPYGRDSFDSRDSL